MKLELTKQEFEAFHMQRDRFQASTYNLINGMMLVGFLHMGPNQIIRAIIIKAEGESFDQFHDPVVEYRAKLRDAAIYIDVDNGRLPELGYMMCDFLDNVRENWRLVDVSAIYDWISRVHESRNDNHNPYLHDGFTLSELMDIVRHSDGQSSFLDNFEKHITIIDERKEVNMTKLTDKEVKLWSDLVIYTANQIDIQKAEKLIKSYENNGNKLVGNDQDLYIEVCSPMMDLKYSTKNLEDTYLPIFENGTEEQWINMWSDANCLPQWNIICKLIHIIRNEGW